MIDKDTLALLGNELSRQGVTADQIIDCLNNNPNGVNTIVSILQTDARRHQRLVNAITANRESVRMIYRWLDNQVQPQTKTRGLFALRTSPEEVLRTVLMGCPEAYVQSIDNALASRYNLSKYEIYSDDEFLNDPGASLKQLAEAMQRHLDHLHTEKAAFLKQYPDTPKLSVLRGDPFDNKIHEMLARNGFTHLAELTQFTVAEIRSLRQIGDKSIEVLVEKLAEHNLAFKSA